MIGILLLILHVLAYSSLGIALYALRSRVSLIPFYLYLGVLQVFVSMMSTFYIIDLGWGIQVGGGNIVYSAVIWSVMLLYIMDRDPDLTKMVILSLVAVQAVFLFLYPLFYTVLESTVVINPLLIPADVFQTSFWIFIVGNILSLFELVAMVFLLEWASKKWSRIPAWLLVITVYIFTLLVDGVLFPLFAFPVTLSISVVQGMASIINKLLLGILFSLTMLVAIALLKPKFTEDPYGRTIRFADLLTLPKKDVVLALRNAEENQAMVQLMLDLLSHDIKNYNQSAHMFLEIIEAHNPDLDKKTKLNIENAKLILKESIDTVSNILILNRIQDGVIQLDSIDLGELFDVALKRVETTYATVSIDVQNRQALDNVTLGSHTLLTEVLYNILANAIKHRRDEATHVFIDLSLKRQKQHIVFGIGDKGPGIPEARKEEIFQRFQKRGQKGVGLSIVRQILARLHSEVWVENRAESLDDYSKGSVFYLKIPLQKNR